MDNTDELWNEIEDEAKAVETAITNAVHAERARTLAIVKKQVAAGEARGLHQDTPLMRLLNAISVSIAAG